jgi:hypothetical protein
MRLAAAFFLFLSQIAFGQSHEPVENNFSEGGLLEMHLRAGAYDIVGTDRSAVRVTFTKDPPDQGPHISLNIAGSKGTLRVDGPAHNFHVHIELPKRTNLFIRLTAGELAIKGIRGSKNIEAHAGELAIDVGDPDNYGSIDASVHSGDLDAHAFGVQKGGLWRSFKQKRDGQYLLHAHVGAGELRLYSVSK